MKRDNVKRALKKDVLEQQNVAKTKSPPQVDNEEVASFFLHLSKNCKKEQKSPRNRFGFSSISRHDSTKMYRNCLGVKDDACPGVKRSSSARENVIPCLAAPTPESLSRLIPTLHENET